MTEIITVDFTPPKSHSGPCLVSFDDGGTSSVPFNTLQAFELRLGDVSGWSFYAISFWGGIKEDSGDISQSNVAEVFLDGWSNGRCRFPVDGVPYTYIQSIYVNRSSCGGRSTNIYFTVDNCNSRSPNGGKIGLEVTMTNSTNPQCRTQFFTSRDPEIKLDKEGG